MFLQFLAAIPIDEYELGYHKGFGGFYIFLGVIAVSYILNKLSKGKWFN